MNTSPNNNTESLDDLRQENEKLKKLLQATLFEIPVGYVPDHTIENLPNLVKGWCKDAIDYYREIEELTEKKDLNTYTETKFGYKNKNNTKWLLLGDFFKAYTVDFHPDVLYSARNVLEDDFDTYARANNLNKEDWELACIEVKYSNYEEKLVTN